MKISVPSPVFFAENNESETLGKLYTLDSCECQQGDEICFRYNKFGYFDTLERQTMGVYKYASTFPMASRNKKRLNHRKKTWHKKI